MGLRSPYPARISPFPCGLREASLRRQEAAVRFSYGFTCSAASTIWFREKFYKFEKNRKPVARIHPYTCRRWHCTIPARAPCEGRSPHGLRTISVRRLRRLHGNCTDIARFPYNLRTVSVRIYPGLPPRPRRRNRTMPVDNVNIIRCSP